MFRLHRGHQGRTNGSATAPTAHRITNAPVGLHDDQSKRQRNYVISMSLRILFLLLVVLTPGWWRWGFAIAAVFIPYFAVVYANGGRERIEQADTLQANASAQLPPKADPVNDPGRSTAP